jgi:hypothetical protein
MEQLLSLPANEFRAALAELQLDPQREADLVREYRRANSALSPVYSLLDRVAGRDADAGMQRADFVPLSRPEGMSVAQAVRSGDARFAMPQGLFDLLGGVAQAADAPAAAAQGLLPAEDMPMEALGVAGSAMGGGGLAARPAGSVGMGGRMLSSDDVLNMADGDFVTLYHGTTKEAADQIRQTGRLQSSGEPSVYLTTDPMGGGYGDGTVVPVRVRRGLLEIDDEFPDGRADFRIDLDRPGGSVGVEIPETPAQQVARMLREGRASDVTDDLMARADPQEMYRLYVAGDTGADLPMDFESRMRRAIAAGFDVNDEMYRGDAPRSAFQTGQGQRDQIGVTMSSRPDVAASYIPARGEGGIYPLVSRGQNDATIEAQGRNWNVIDRDARVAFQGEKAALRDYIPNSHFELYDVMSGTDFLDTNDLSRMFQGYGADRVRFNDLVDRGGSARYYGPESSMPSDVVMVANPANVRSRFARFDPRLSHLSNLNAANVDPITGAAAVSASQQNDPLANLRAYIAASGGVLGR